MKTSGKTALGYCSAMVTFALVTGILMGCTTTPSTSTDLSAPVLAVAKQWQNALVTRNFDQALSLVASDFTSPKWSTREDLRVYLDEARDRNYFDPAAASTEKTTVTVTGDQVTVYPVSIRARAGVTVFSLTLAPRDADWKITSATVEFY